MFEGDRMLERVRRLLAKAEGAATEAERDAYNAKAAELIARYGIEEALLAADQQKRQEPGDRVVELHPPYARDKGSLLAAVATPLRVRVVLRSGGGMRGATARLSMHLFGMDVDLERVDLLYTSLLVQAAHGLAVARPDDPYESVAAYRRSWMIGFAAVIQRRLSAAEAAVTAEADAVRSRVGSSASASLVLADRSVLVDAAVSQAYPQLRTARSRSLSGSGSADGAAAARRADLGGRRLGRRGRAALP
jgi:hypothetical protein